jgi:hypothetical protein
MHQLLPVSGSATLHQHQGHHRPWRLKLDLFSCPDLARPVLVNTICVASSNGGWFRSQVSNFVDLSQLVSAELPWLLTELIHCFYTNRPLDFLLFSLINIYGSIVKNLNCVFMLSFSSLCPLNHFQRFLCSKSVNYHKLQCPICLQRYWFWCFFPGR